MLRLFRRDTSSDSPAHDRLDVLHEGQSYSVALKRVTGARRFTLRVRAATRDVVLTMPNRGSMKAAHDFAQRHAAWIAARLHRLPKAVPFRPGFIIPIRGDDHLIVHADAARGGIKIDDIKDGNGVSRVLRVLCGEEYVPRRISDFLKREAKADLETAVRHHTKQLGYAARRVTVRDTTSRWGSCSASGSLNFSWRLVMSPPFVLDYLAAHEVAHLVHMNHSEKFWELTRQLAPHTDRAETWLKAHGTGLHRFGAEPVVVSPPIRTKVR
jgi:predicted metal-dependent hydrolase